MNIGKRFITVFLLLLSFLQSSESSYKDIDWSINYRDAIKTAQHKNRPVMVLITSKRCKWCKKLKYETLSNEAIIDRLNDNFVTVEIDRYKRNYPYKRLRVRVVPTIYFLDKNGKPLMRPVIGYWSAENFNSYLDDVERRLKRRR